MHYKQWYSQENGTNKLLLTSINTLVEKNSKQKKGAIASNYNKYYEKNQDKDCFQATS
jgi:hypothetical protein